MSATFLQAMQLLQRQESKTRIFRGQIIFAVGMLKSTGLISEEFTLSGEFGKRVSEELVALAQLEDFTGTYDEAKETLNSFVQFSESDSWLLTHELFIRRVILRVLFPEEADTMEIEENHQWIACIIWKAVRAEVEGKNIPNLTW